MTQPTKAFVLTDEIVKFLKERAAEEDRSVSWIVRSILEREMERSKQDEKQQA